MSHAPAIPVARATGSGPGPGPEIEVEPEIEVDRQLGACQVLLDAYAAQAYARFGAAALGVVDLPVLSGARVDAAAIGVAAALLWTREVEAAGLPRFVDALVQPRRTADGRIRPPRMVGYPFPAAAVAHLERYRRALRDRPDETTRRAYHERVFGAPFGRDFEALVDTLTGFGREPDILRPRIAGIQAAAESVGALLTRRVQGAVQYAAQRIVDAVVDGLRILRAPQVQQAMGRGMSRSPFALIERHAPQVLGEAVSPRPHLARAQAGAAVLSWLQGVAPMVAGGGALPLSRNANVIRAAERWRSLRTAPGSGG